MGEMVDRVAQAMHEWVQVRRPESTPWKDLPEHERRPIMSHARAAIAAIREPTEAMIIAGVRFENMGDMAGRWRAMIDKALED